MGAGVRINAAYQHYLGWLGDEDVTIVRQSGSYRVWPIDAGYEFTTGMNSENPDAINDFTKIEYGPHSPDRNRAILVPKDFKSAVDSVSAVYCRFSECSVP
jgi:hypothetical protein